MSLIQNDAYQGIRDKATYDHIKAVLHPGLLGKFQKGISVEKAHKTTFLNLRTAVSKCDAIKDLDFLKFFPNLETLFLESKSLSNIDGLQYLTWIACLELSSDWTEGVDIFAISKCRGLKELAIDLISGPQTSKPSTNIKGLDALRDLTKLRCLYLPGMWITDISFIKHLTALEDLELGHNPIADLTPLQGHSSLNELDLSTCGLTDISILSTIPNLQCLNIGYNQIKDFSPLKELRHLKHLFAGGNSLTDAEIEHWQKEFNLNEEFNFREP